MIRVQTPLGQNAVMFNVDRFCGHDAPPLRIPSEDGHRYQGWSLRTERAASACLGWPAEKSSTSYWQGQSNPADFSTPRDRRTKHE